MPDKEVLLEDKTMIRRSGSVNVATVPSSIMKNPIVKQSKGKQGTIRLVREGRQVYLQIPLQTSFDGRILEVRRKEKHE